MEWLMNLSRDIWEEELRKRDGKENGGGVWIYYITKENILWLSEQIQNTSNPAYFEILA